MIWLLLPIFILMGMWGGQWCKGIRRFGIPGLATTSAGVKDIKDKKVRWKVYLLSLLSFLLALGYGENSFLMKVFKKDWLVRIVYGVLLSVPFLVLKVWVAPLLLAGAWSIRAGGFVIYKDYDFLWEDFLRYSTLGSLICHVL